MHKYPTLYKAIEMIALDNNIPMRDAPCWPEHDGGYYENFYKK